MTDERKVDPEADDAALDDAAMRDLLRGALRPPPSDVAPRLLPGVQRKLRDRSAGKFYADGWSTSTAPRSTYLVTALVMLALCVIAFVMLVPWSVGKLP